MAGGGRGGLASGRESGRGSRNPSLPPQRVAGGERPGRAPPLCPCSAKLLSWAALTGPQGQDADLKIVPEADFLPRPPLPAGGCPLLQPMSLMLRLRLPTQPHHSQAKGLLISEPQFSFLQNRQGRNYPGRFRDASQASPGVLRWRPPPAWAPVRNRVEEGQAGALRTEAGGPRTAGGAHPLIRSSNTRC